MLTSALVSAPSSEPKAWEGTRRGCRCSRRRAAGAGRPGGLTTAPAAASLPASMLAKFRKRGPGAKSGEVVYAHSFQSAHGLCEIVGRGAWRAVAPEVRDGKQGGGGWLWAKASTVLCCGRMVHKQMLYLHDCGARGFLLITSVCWQQRWAGRCALRRRFSSPRSRLALLCRQQAPL